jgi:hypothetical protein
VLFARLAEESGTLARSHGVPKPPPDCSPVVLVIIAAGGAASSSLCDVFRNPNVQTQLPDVF